MLLADTFCTLYTLLGTSVCTFLHMNLRPFAAEPELPQPTRSHGRPGRRTPHHLPDHPYPKSHTRQRRRGIGEDGAGRLIGVGRPARHLLQPQRRGCTQRPFHAGH